MHRIGTENGTVKASADTQNASNMEVAMEAKTSSEKREFCIEKRELPQLGLGIAINSIKRWKKRDIFFDVNDTPCHFAGETYLFLTIYDQ